MRIDSKTPIAGLPSLKVRDFFRKYKSYEFFNIEDVATHFGLSPKLSNSSLKKLLKLGYIKKTKTPQGDLAWKVTTEGNALSLANAGPPVKRINAESMIQEFLNRVNLVNNDPHYLKRVTKVVVFGSFLGEKIELGDVDLAVDLQWKEEDPEKNQRILFGKIKDALDAGKNFSSPFDQIFWPEQEVWQFLKSRCRGLNLHPYSVHEKFLEKQIQKVIFPEKRRASPRKSLRP
jgi:predicted nucleotidyltransferase